MPLIVLTGIPCSGKSRRASELKSYFEELDKKVHLVSENVVVQNQGAPMNQLFLDSSKEKETRGLIKAEAQRLIGREDVVIIDGGNYIKGYRYELYCMSKTSKTTQCTIHCEIAIETAWEFNSLRPEEDQYSRETFDALVMRYEAPDNRNRWDSPLFTVMPENDLPLESISSALFERRAPPPNQSTQNAPLSTTNFLFAVDRITQEITTAILSAQKTGVEGEIKIPGYSCTIEISSALTAPQLTRLRRQYLSYTRQHPPNDLTKIGPLFVQFINSYLK